VFIRLGSVITGDRAGCPSDGSRTLCGEDDRTLASSLRVGRVSFGSCGGGATSTCTAYLALNGTLLTAGHCADHDPPDGVLDLIGVVEFDFPLSQSDGTPVCAHPDDQYPIDTSSVVWHFDAQGLGKDWAVFRCLPNSNTRLRPHEAQGSFYRLSRAAPDVSDPVAVLGCGSDDTPLERNVVLQIGVGSYEGEGHDGADYWHQYRADTTGGCSGGPIHWADTDLSIGIHTNGQCDASPTSTNKGTSFQHDPLADALQDFFGPNTTYVDAYPRPFPTGSVFHPWLSVEAGVQDAVEGGRVVIVTGSYPETLVLNKAVIMMAPAGPAIIGQ
jgi:hypothetical protein